MLRSLTLPWPKTINGSMSEILPRFWPLALNLILYLASCYGLWIGSWKGETGWLIPLGIAGLVIAGIRGISWPLVLLALPIYALRYLIYMAPLFLGIGMSNTKTFVALLGTATWEAFPVLVAVGVGLHLVRRKAPIGAMFLIVAGLFTGLAVWLPRPYTFSIVAPIYREIPGMIWAFGNDLTAGLLLGMVFVLGVWLARPVALKSMLISALGATAVLGLTHVGYLRWQGQCGGMSRKVVEHDVMAIPGALPPFIANFKGMSDRALYPMVLFSGMKPDLIMGPENLVQADKTLDPDDETSTTQRHVTAIGTAIAVPYSQSLFGARDHHTSRIYFSDIVNQKPRVQWKDLEKRSPGVDYTIPWLNKAFTKDYLPSIKPAKDLPLMDLWKRRGSLDASVEDGGLSRVSRAVITMSGELRDPHLVRKVVKDPSITAAMNPNIGGWLGNLEAVGASIQARARLLELGLIGYRVGQSAGTELIVPWLDQTAPATIAPNKAFIRFASPLPYQRLDTGYTAGLWLLALYLVPAVSLALLALWLLGSLVPAAYRLRA